MRIETNMPVNPESPEHKAPIRKLMTTLFAIGAVKAEA